MKTQRQVIQEVGLIQRWDREGRLCFGFGDAQKYVKALGFKALADWRPMKVRMGDPFDYVETDEQGVSTYIARQSGNGLWIEEVLVEPVRGFGLCYPVWLYPVEVLDAVMAQVSTNGGSEEI